MAGCGKDAYRDWSPGQSDWRLVGWRVVEEIFDEQVDVCHSLQCHDPNLVLQRPTIENIS